MISSNVAWIGLACTWASLTACAVSPEPISISAFTEEDLMNNGFDELTAKVLQSTCTVGMGCVRGSGDIEACEEALEAYQASGDLHMTAHTLIRLANHGPAERRQERHEAALSIASDLGNDWLLRSAIDSAAEWYARSAFAHPGSMDRIDASLQLATDLAAEANAEVVVISMPDIGYGLTAGRETRVELNDEALVVRNRTHAARGIALYERLLEPGVEEDSEREFLRASIHLSDLHQALGNVDRALSVLERAGAIPEPASFSYDRMRLFQRLGELPSLRGEWKEALKAVRQARATVEDEQRVTHHDFADPDLAQLLWIEGLILERMGDPSSAAVAMRSGVERMEREGELERQTLLARQAKLARLEAALREE